MSGAREAGRNPAVPVAPLTLGALESFYIGGGTQTLPLAHSAADAMMARTATETYARGAMYVRRLAPVAARCPIPVIMIHGGGLTGMTWETTPDGREGWATLFVRGGFDTYVVDQAWRGRSAPDLSGLDPTVRGAPPPGPALGIGTGIAALFARGGGRFPLDRSLDFAAQLWPDFGAWPAIAQGRPGLADARALDPLLALIDRLGRVALLTHSQGGSLGWRAALARPLAVAAILSIEPAETLPDLDAPGFPDIPVRIVWGDNLPEMAPVLSRKDLDEARGVAARRPLVEVDYLPEAGICGNGHMLMMEDNSAALAERAMAWFRARLAERD